jgi:hypothetical protein
MAEKPKTGRHRAPEMPRTGNGHYGTGHPPRLELSQKTSSGTILWKATAALFGVSKKKS